MKLAPTHLTFFQNRGKARRASYETPADPREHDFKLYLQGANAERDAAQVLRSSWSTAPTRQSASWAMQTFQIKSQDGETIPVKPLRERNMNAPHAREVSSVKDAKTSLERPTHPSRISSRWTRSSITELPSVPEPFVFSDDELSSTSQLMVSPPPRRTSRHASSLSASLQGIAPPPPRIVQAVGVDEPTLLSAPLSGPSSRLNKVEEVGLTLSGPEIGISSLQIFGFDGREIQPVSVTPNCARNRLSNSRSSMHNSECQHQSHRMKVTIKLSTAVLIKRITMTGPDQVVELFLAGKPVAFGEFKDGRWEYGK